MLLSYMNGKSIPIKNIFTDYKKGFTIKQLENKYAINRESIRKRLHLACISESRSKRFCGELNPNGKKIKFIINNSGCHICISHVGHHGYPAFSRNNKSYRIHRFIWEQKFGKISEGLVICHKCDNKRCINLNHLFIGTQADNVHDAINKGLFKRSLKHDFQKNT